MTEDRIWPGRLGWRKRTTKEILELMERDRGTFYVISWEGCQTAVVNAVDLYETLRHATGKRFLGGERAEYMGETIRLSMELLNAAKLSRGVGPERGRVHKWLPYKGLADFRRDYKYHFDRLRSPRTRPTDRYHALVELLRRQLLFAGMVL